MNKVLRNFFFAAMAMMSVSAMAQTTVTFDAAVDKGTCDANNAGADQVTKDGVTIAVSNGAMMLTDQYRCYKGSTFTVTSTAGNIQKVELTCTAEGAAKYGPGCFTDATAGAYAFDGKVGTWTGDVSTFTMTASTNQVRMNKVVVTLAGGSSGSGATEKYVATVVDANGIVSFAKEYGDVCEPVYETVKVDSLDAEGNVVNDEAGNPIKVQVEKIKYYKATNVVDGKVVVKIATPNVDVEAVGGAVPAKDETIASGAQAINADGTVREWEPINWNLGNHKTDINDEAGTKLYTVMGSGNPYVGLNAVQVTKEGEVIEGAYKADYVFYEPDGSLGLPLVGLYYKFMPKVAGTFKIQIWANKGNRKTFLVDESTKKAIGYKVEGYINGQKVKDAEGNNYKNADGNEVMQFFDSEAMEAQHKEEYDARVDKLVNPGEGKEGISEEEAKAKVDAEFPVYIIGKGNQAFWGWLTFEAEAGKSYWLFQHSSQIGFGGYEFTPAGGEAGIAKVKTARVDTPAYNLAGQRVDDNYKGIVIKNGVKIMQK